MRAARINDTFRRMTIIPAGRHHVPHVFEILSACARDLRERGIHQWDEHYPTVEIVEADFAAGRMHVVVEEDRVIGSISLCETQDAEYARVAWTHEEPALVIHRLCVLPEMQGRGIASRLLEHAEKLAVERGYLSIRLDTYTGNPTSVALYLKRGYTIAGQISFPRRELPFHCMEKKM